MCHCERIFPLHPCAAISLSAHHYISWATRCFWATLESPLHFYCLSYFSDVLPTPFPTFSPALLPAFLPAFSIVGQSLRTHLPALTMCGNLLICSSLFFLGDSRVASTFILFLIFGWAIVIPITIACSYFAIFTMNFDI